MRNDTIRIAVSELSGLLRNNDTGDPAQLAAYTLVPCAAAVELDDYETCFQALDRLIDRISVENADAALVKAVILQQKALRRYDAGLPHLRGSLEAGTLISEIKAEDFSDFDAGPNNRQTSRETVAAIIVNLRNAIGSLIPMDAIEREGISFLARRPDQTRRPESELAVSFSVGRAAKYSDYVQDVFREQFDQHSRSIGGRKHPDLFAATMALELAGDGSVHTARRDLALLRLAQGVGVQPDLADSVRLLRHAGAKNELTLVLRRLRDAGPLDALEQDARQILRRRAEPHLLRVVELQVLQAAAELLTPDLARRGLAAVMAVLDAGGPPNLPGRWELPLLRRAAGWSAAAALSNACDAASDVAEYLLTVAHSAHEDHPLTDRSLRRALSELDWDKVQMGVRQQWYEQIPSFSASLPGTVALLSKRAGVRVPPAPGDPPIMRLAHDLNFAMSMPQLDAEVFDNGLDSLRQDLKLTREAARGGVFYTRTFDSADIAACLIDSVGVVSLWPELAAFLLDGQVSRDDRSAAFDRLAAAKVELPHTVADDFREGIGEVLATSSISAFGPAVNPFPAALRFAAVHGIIDEADIYEHVCGLLGGTDAVSRREGTATITLLARRRLFPWLLPMVLPLTNDANIEVRAQAACALVLLAGRGGPAGQVAHRRILDLLAADGTLVPAVTMHTLEERSDLLDEPIRRRLAELAENHVWHSIRENAAALLGGRGPGLSLRPVVEG